MGAAKGVTKMTRDHVLGIKHTPVGPAPELVGCGVVRIELDGAVAVSDASIGLLQLEEAVAPLGEHGGRLGVEEDGLGEQVTGLLEVAVREG